MSAGSIVARLVLCPIFPAPQKADADAIKGKADPVLAQAVGSHVAVAKSSCDFGPLVT